MKSLLKSWHGTRRSNGVNAPGGGGGKHPTSNNEHPTSNERGSRNSERGEGPGEHRTSNAEHPDRPQIVLVLVLDLLSRRRTRTRTTEGRRPYGGSKRQNIWEFLRRLSRRKFRAHKRTGSRVQVKWWWPGRHQEFFETVRLATFIFTERRS